MSEAMVTGIWNNVRLICGNHPEGEQHEMAIVSGPHSLFYACPKYDALNRTEDEPTCYNRLNLIDYEKMLNHISNEFVKADANDEVVNLSHHKWKDKTREFEVLRHTQDEIVIRFIDRVAILGHKV